MQRSVLFVALTSLLLSLLPSLHAQFNSYTAAPRLWHTFDTEPAPIVYAPNTTSFTWSRGLQPHEGTVLLNGVDDFIDLYLVPDDYGRTLPRTMPRSVSFEWWVKWNALNSYARMLDCGNGIFSDNIYVSNVGRSNDLRAAFYRGNSTAPVSQAINAPQAIHPNTWQHVVVTIRQKNRFDIQSNNSAEIDIYVDGKLYVRQMSATLPAMLARMNCWIGRSEWKAYDPNNTDEYFYGWIDDFFWYDYPLGQEEVLAHFVLPRPPVYELTFSHDPRLIQAAAYNYTYSWSTVDDKDPSNVTAYHAGHLVLTGDQYIDLEAGSGNSSVGATAMPVVGGWNSGANGTLPMGWSFEVLFKASTQEWWAKVFDVGSGVGVDNLILGYYDNTTLLRFEVYNSESNNQSIQTVIPNTTLGHWYHVVLTLAPYQFAGSRVSRLHVYVDGKLMYNIAYFNTPRAVRRTHAYIGKSNWANEYMDMYLDTFRLYDYALTADEVAALYVVTHEELPNATVSGVISHEYHTGPVSSYTFTRRPTGMMVEGTNFRWDGGTLFRFPHEGVALFNGRGEYINLAAYPSNAAGTPLGMIGGAFSIECWVQWDGVPPLLPHRRPGLAVGLRGAQHHPGQPGTHQQPHVRGVLGQRAVAGAGDQRAGAQRVGTHRGVGGAAECQRHVLGHVRPPPSVHQRG